MGTNTGRTHYERLELPDAAPKIKSFLTTSRESTIQVTPHWHKETELLVFLAGYAVQQVDNRYFIASPGDIVIISKDQLHSTYSYENSQCEIQVVQFDSSVFSALMVPGSQNLDLLAFNNPLSSAVPRYQGAAECLARMDRELAGREPAYELEAAASLLRFYSLVLRGGEYTSSPDGGLDDRRREALFQVLSLVEERYGEDIPLERAARAASLSVPQFCRVFKEATGMTFMSFLALYRVNRAEALLRTDKTMLEVAFESGFNSVSAFNRNFKRYKNYTPTEWLNELK